jgi:hypothetical protein
MGVHSIRSIGGATEVNGGIYFKGCVAMITVAEDSDNIGRDVRD